MSGDNGKKEDKKITSLLKKLRKCTPWKREEIAIAAFGKGGEAKKRLHEAILSGRLREEPGEIDLGEAILLMMLNGGLRYFSKVTAEQIAQYLTTVDEQVTRHTEFLQGSDSIADLLYPNPEPFAERLNLMPYGFQHGIACLLTLAGYEPVLPGDFVEWLGGQFQRRFPDIRVPPDSDWDDMSGTAMNYRIIKTIDYDTGKLTANGRRFIELFTTIDEWKAARGEDAYLPDVE